MQTARGPLSCPNCRGAPTIIAIWKYIDETRITQGEVENELTQNTTMHQISTPPDQETDLSNSQSSEFVRVPTPIPQESPLRDPEGSPVALGPPIPPFPPHFPVFDDSKGQKSCFHIQTQLPDGRPSLLIDPGSVGNLCGDKWAKEVAKQAAWNQRSPQYTQRPKPLKVSGVGNGAQACHFDCQLPIAFKQGSEDSNENQQSIREGNINIPTVANSELPGLLGLTALRKNRAILDLNTLKVYFCGPGDYDLLKELPPGTDSFQAELAPSGHMVLPCCEFRGSKPNENEYTLTMVTQPPGLTQESPVTNRSKRQRPSSIPPPPEMPAPTYPQVVLPPAPNA